MSLRSKYKNIRVQVACLPVCDRDIRKVFYEILDDYCKRFNVEATKEKTLVQICFIEYEDPDGDTYGLHIFSEDNKRILIQIRDPLLHGWESNNYTMVKMVEVMCHEFVHACQALTGRNGFKIPKAIYDKGNEREKYFFDPSEVEARVFEAFYATQYSNVLI